jgi:beta-aspartyl-peptidase (threonine type)
LVGKGAEIFAEKMGFQKANLTTEKSSEIYHLFLKDAFHTYSDNRIKEYLEGYVVNFDLKNWYRRLSEDQYGTVNIIAMDLDGNIASSVSTSGTFLKFPGRLGDTPIIGAGNYCDNRYGAATCTGRGELAIRLCTARTIISYMENGLDLVDSCVRALSKVKDLKEFGDLNVLAMDNKGNTTSATTKVDQEVIYYYMDISSEEPERRVGININ